MTAMLQGERFHVTYRVASSAQNIMPIASALCLEETVEFPADILPDSVEPGIVGSVESAKAIDDNHWEVTISYAHEVTGGELPQMLNVVFGNISLWPGIRVQRLALSPSLAATFGGPRFGEQGLRQRLGVWDRALLATAIKPMGRSAKELATIAGQCAEGGIDLIKDDHGLANQSFAPWRDRIHRCADAVAQANAKTGGKSLYLPNITGPWETMQERAAIAQATGAGGLLIAPGLTGFDAMRHLAQDRSIDLPIMAHPTFLGSYVLNPEQGISPYALLGQLMRVAGADAVIYPNYGGRFAFTREQCLEIVQGLTDPLQGLASSLPTPGGGMTIARVPEMVATYGHAAILLIGGDLFRGSDSLVAKSQRFREQVTKASA